MRKILAFLLFVMAMPSFAEVETVWLKDSRQLACSPSKLHSSGMLTLILGPDHGRELGVRRHSDSTWHFLVVARPPDNAKNLMEPEIFQNKKQVIIPASSMTTEWSTGNEVPIFPSSGIYSIYTSSNLESEFGGYMCTIEYVR